MPTIGEIDNDATAAMAGRIMSQSHKSHRSEKDIDGRPRRASVDVPPMDHHLEKLAMRMPEEAISAPPPEKGDNADASSEGSGDGQSGIHSMMSASTVGW